MKANEEQHSLPAHLIPLLQPTPSGISKLLAAWDGLGIETQIVLLASLERIRCAPYLVLQVHGKALASPNAYVRYLAAKGLDLDSEMGADAKRRIDEDSSPLVRYCKLEEQHPIFDEQLRSPEEFFALPHEARLAKVRCLCGNGERIANLISYAVEHELIGNKVSEIELHELLSDYLNNPEFDQEYKTDHLSYDGLLEYSKGNDIDELWKLVSKVPEAVSYILIERLPAAAGLGTKIPETVMAGLSDYQMRTLLYRSDIELPELRKNLFWSCGKERDGVRQAAISHNFDLEYSEFGTVLRKPGKERVELLQALAMAHDLSLCIYQAIHDALFASDVGMFDFEDAEFARARQERRVQQLKGWEKKQQLLQLRLYLLAARAVPWDTSEEVSSPAADANAAEMRQLKKERKDQWKRENKSDPPSGDLAFLSGSIVPGDTWETFAAFSSAWSALGSKAASLEELLPTLYDDFSTDAQPAYISDQMAERLAKIESFLEAEEPTSKQAVLVAEIGKLVAEASGIQARREDALEAEVKQLQAGVGALKMLLYVALALIVFLLVRR